MEEPVLNYDGWHAVRRIGAGSFSTVYEIERPILGKTERAALKVISIPRSEVEVEELRTNGYDDRSITAHFNESLKHIVQEYMFMTEMKGHPNIVYCDDIKYVQKDSGFGWNIYIRMELLRPLARVIETDYSENDVIRIGADITRALKACHEKNIIHRDIKPHNIFISRTGEYKLGDFGVAKVLENTSGGTIIGTVNFMAPEVYNNQPYDKTADLYSLGMVLYWLMNEKRFPFVPLPPNTPTYSDMDESLKRRFHGYPFPDPAHGSDEFKQIILKACAFNPKDRYQTADEMLRDLEGILGINTTDRHPVSHNEQKTQSLTGSADKTTRMDDKTAPFTKRKKPVLGIAIAVLALLALSGLLLHDLLAGNESQDNSAGDSSGKNTPGESASGSTADKGTVNIGLVLDFSGSMLFPARLDAVSSEPIQITEATLDELVSLNPDISPPYFFVANPETSATVYRIEYDDGWYYSDSSYWIYDDQPEQRPISEKPLRFSDKKDQFVVYTAGQKYIDGMKSDPYAAVTDSYNRLAYLKESVISFVRKLKDEMPENASVSLAWNSFCKTLISSSDFVSLSDSNKDENFSAFSDQLKIMRPTAGTNHAAGLEDAIGFSWNQNDASGRNYTIMITDGYLDGPEAAEAAQSLKDKGIEVIVIGMNIPDFRQFQEMFEPLASKSRGRALVFACESTNEMEAVLTQDLYEYITQPD